MFGRKKIKELERLLKCQEITIKIYQEHFTRKSHETFKAPEDIHQGVAGLIQQKIDSLCEKLEHLEFCEKCNSHQLSSHSVVLDALQNETKELKEKLYATRKR